MDTEQEIKQLKICIMVMGIVMLVIFIFIVVGDSIKWKAQLGFNEIVQEGIDDITTHLITSKYDIQEMYEYFNVTQPSDSQGVTWCSECNKQINGGR